MIAEQSSIQINARLSLPADEVRFTFSRAGGPGGQNVNKVNTRATLWFDVEGSPSLSARQKGRIRRRLAGRTSKEGVLRVDGGRFRTQKANRDDVLERFIGLLAKALTEKPVRKKTKVPGRAREKRLQEKKRKSSLKADRAKKNLHD